MTRASTAAARLSRQPAVRVVLLTLGFLLLLVWFADDADADELTVAVPEVDAAVAEQVTEPVAEVAEQIAEPAAEVAEQIAEPAAEVAEQIAEPAAEVAERIAEPAAEVAEQIAEPAAEAVTAAAAATLQRAQPVVDVTLPPVVEVAPPPVVEVVAPVVGEASWASAAPEVAVTEAPATPVVEVLADAAPTWTEVAAQPAVEAVAHAVRSAPVLTLRAQEGRDAEPVPAGPIAVERSVVEGVESSAGLFHPADQTGVLAEAAEDAPDLPAGPAAGLSQPLRVATAQSMTQGGPGPDGSNVLPLFVAVADDVVLPAIMFFGLLALLQSLVRWRASDVLVFPA